MSFYRTLLAVVAAAAIASPVFADDTTMQNTSATTTTTTTATTTDQTTAMDTKVNLNKATAKDLMKVKGLNASKARAIVAFRKKHGDFKSVEDLTKVKGFAKMKTEELKTIQDQLVTE